MDNQIKEINQRLKTSLRLKNQNKPGQKKLLGFGLLIVILILLIVSAPAIGNSLKREIVISNRIIDSLSSMLPLNIQDKERVNLLFLGIGGESNPAPNLTDTIILINSTQKAEDIKGISIPRDLLIKYPGANYYTKINALYQSGGIGAIEEVVAEITGQQSDFYLVLDLNAVKILIDKLGGIDVEVEEDIYDPQFPGSDNSYETFSLSKGNHHLDGETALKYIRTRHQPEGDFSRIKRQQQVISALKDKILSLNFIWNFPTILSIWKTLQNNAQTNIGLTDLKYAWDLAKNTNLDEIQFTTLDADFLIPAKTILNGLTADVLEPRAGLNNYEDIKNYITNLINNL
jgi:LCP family protein required for cell wall assembly